MRLADDTLVQIVKLNHADFGTKGYAFQSGRKYRVYRVEGGLIGWFTRSQIKRIAE